MQWYSKEFDREENLLAGASAVRPPYRMEEKPVGKWGFWPWEMFQKRLGDQHTQEEVDAAIATLGIENRAYCLLHADFSKSKQGIYCFRAYFTTEDANNILAAVDPTKAGGAAKLAAHNAAQQAAAAERRRRKAELKARTDLLVAQARLDALKEFEET